MQHGVACPVSDCAGSVGLFFAVFFGLSSEGSLVNFAFFGSGEGESVGFELEDGFGGLFTHVVDGVLVAQPVAAFYCVVGVPPPIIGVHIAKSSIDATLGCDGMRPGGEQFGDACSFEALLDKSEGGSESGSSCSHNHRVEGVVDYCILLEEGVLDILTVTSASLE